MKTINRMEVLQVAIVVVASILFILALFDINIFYKSYRVEITLHPPSEATHFIIYVHDSTGNSILPEWTVETEPILLKETNVSLILKYPFYRKPDAKVEILIVYLKYEGKLLNQYYYTWLSEEKLTVPLEGET